MSGYQKITKAVKTRKDHLCFLCGTTIPKGTECEYQELADDGCWNLMWICDGCNAFSCEFQVHDDGVYYENCVYEYMVDYQSRDFNLLEFIVSLFGFGYTPAQVRELRRRLY